MFINSLVVTKAMINNHKVQLTYSSPSTNLLSPLSFFQERKLQIPHTEHSPLKGQQLNHNENQNIELHYCFIP